MLSVKGIYDGIFKNTKFLWLTKWKKQEKNL